MWVGTKECDLYRANSLARRNNKEVRSDR